MKAIIVAAGQGVRIREESGWVPKTLLPFGDRSILSWILRGFASVGVEEFVIVVGFEGERIVEHLRRHRDFGFRVCLVSNPDWTLGNGVSALRGWEGRGDGEEAFLAMSDHLVHPRALARIVAARSRHNLLLTDTRVDEVFDLDDATKVRQEGGRIVSIGKQLEEYNAVDCGVFRVNERFGEALAEAIEAGEDGISDGVRRLIAADDMRSVPFPADCGWQDIDTPSAYREAIARRVRFGETAPKVGSAVPGADAPVDRA